MVRIHSIENPLSLIKNISTKSDEDFACFASLKQGWIFNVHHDKYDLKNIYRKQLITMKFS